MAELSDLIPSRREPMRLFLRNGALFLLGLLVSAVVLDAAVGRYMRHASDRRLIGGEVYIAVRKAAAPDDRVRVLFLGDSVARQLFHAGEEPGADVRFLATNQAISVAGQCYLLEDALRHWPNLRTVYFFYLPGAWANNLPREFSHDYFCGYFHRLDEVAEVFKVKRDLELSTAHVGRWLLPNLLAFNSTSHPAVGPGVEPTRSVAGAPIPPPPDPEPLVSALSKICREPAMPVVAPVGADQALPVVLSPVSRYFLAKMRRLCEDRGVALHILPDPCSTAYHYVDAAHLYDGPLFYVSPDKLVDAVHFREPYIAEACRTVVSAYGLDPRFASISPRASR